MQVSGNKRSAVSQAVGATTKRPYLTPRLIVYGDVKVLTQSGSGNSTEQAQTGSLCSLDARKSCL